jgi:hypothetical protein
MPIFLNLVGQGPCRSDCKLLVNVCYLFESPKVALIFQQMFQNRSIMEINVPTKAQIKLKLCLIIRCRQDKLGLGHLGKP